MSSTKARLIALDIDETILNRPAGVPVHSKVREAVRDAREAGAKVCLCSARPTYFMKDALSGLDEVDALIGCSGAMIVKDGEIIYKNRMEKPLLMACYETGKRLDAYFSFAGENHLFIPRKGPRNPTDDDAAVFIVMEDDELIEKIQADDFYCAFIFVEPGTMKEAVFLDPVFASASIQKSSSNAFEILNEGTNKGTGVLKLAELWNIPREEILAVGNDENDITMFKVAGVGVAVGNARADVKAAADWIAPDVLHGGAADAIRRFAL